MARPRRSRGPRESWLLSDDSSKYAAAMVRCQSGDPSGCSSDGICRRDGECFEPDEEEKQDQLDRIEDKRDALLELLEKGAPPGCSNTPTAS